MTCPLETGRNSYVSKMVSLREHRGFLITELQPHCLPSPSGKSLEEFAEDDSGIALGIFVLYVACSNIEGSEYLRRSAAFICAQQSSLENCFC